MLKKNISDDKKNCKYEIEVPLYGYSKEEAEKKLTNINNSFLKEKMKENYHRAYIYQFYLDDNPYLDYYKWMRIFRNLSEKGEAVIFRKFHKEKFHYIPVTIVKKNLDSIGGIRELTIEYDGKQEKLTNLNDYQIIFNNPERKPDLVEFEKDFNLLVSIQDEISKQTVNQYPRVILETSRPLKDEEIEEFRKQWEGEDAVVFLPPGVNSVKDARPPLKTNELWEKFEIIRKELDKKIARDIKENKEIKYEERLKAFKEMEKKWGIEISLHKRH